jgi:DNA-binding cell septation regulator SpoVG
MTVEHSRDQHKVKIVALKPFPKAGNLRAFVSVRLGSVVVHDLRIVQQPGQKAWVSLPQKEYQQDGQKKYSAIVELSESLKREVSRLVLAEWERQYAPS